MDPLPTLVADVKTVLSDTNPLNAGSLIKAGVKLCLDSKSLLALPHDQKVGMLSKAMLTALMELKEKELAKCSDDQKAAVNDRYAHLLLVAESGLPAVLETVHEIFTGKLNLSSLKQSAASWFSWFSCVATSAVSVAAATGLVSEKQAAEIPKKVEDVVTAVQKKVEAVTVPVAVPVAVPVTVPVPVAVPEPVTVPVAVPEPVPVTVPVPVAVAEPSAVVVDLSGAAAPVETLQSTPTDTAGAENKQ